MRNYDNEMPGFQVWVGSCEDVMYLVANVGFCLNNDVSSLPPLPLLVRGRRIEQSPSSSNTLYRASQWVEECNTNHNTCAIRKAPLPRRVLDLAQTTTPGTIKRVETDGEHASYACLSYCWGTVLHFTTTKATLDARKSGIDILDLPKTFQDAILIVSGLGVRYLWIDCLCICQDDVKDWERESSKMASIYSNSYIAIAAAAAVDSTQGCLIPRRPPRYVEINLPTSAGADRSLLAFLRPANRAQDVKSYMTFSDEPLSQRGWVLQERFFAPRTIHFASDQMYFECHQNFVSEDRILTNERYFTYWPDYRRLAERTAE
ncbi:HET-domain-containing protein [Aulographum hederae CBS 113979]|uniref:HET-domain-containing protein n=1 Tax=Aulographum hederae CBS 113979 TaxID=1176131 RepID=A0A6G1GWN1_9PEZI|nr:HET-domain-containing protein [Aulographum hederae CBS 113979]